MKGEREPKGEPMGDVTCEARGDVLSFHLRTGGGVLGPPIGFYKTKRGRGRAHAPVRSRRIRCVSLDHFRELLLGLVVHYLGEFLARPVISLLQHPEPLDELCNLLVTKVSTKTTNGVHGNTVHHLCFREVALVCNGRGKVLRHSVVGVGRLGKSG